MLLLGCSLIGGRGAVLEELAPLHCVSLLIVFTKDSKHDSLAEWSKALASGASPQGRGFEPHSCQLARRQEGELSARPLRYMRPGTLE